MLLLRSLPLILPYDVMDYLIGSCNLHIEEELINQFWSHLDSVEDSWALSTREFRKAVGDKVIPLGFYGDEACMGLVTDPYNQIYGLFMSVVLFRPTSTRMSRYLLFSVDSHRIHSVEETFSQCWNKLQHPSTDCQMKESMDGISWFLKFGVTSLF